MRIDIWSDIACPWCYIGKRRLESAVEGFAHRDDVEVVWHSFELDPGAPVPPTEKTSVHLARKYGGGPGQIAEMTRRVAETAQAQGLDYRLDDTMHVATRDAHRLLHLALESGGAAQQGALKERLLEDYFVRALDVSDHAVLRAAATEVGLAEAEVDRVLTTQAYHREVSADIEQARAYGANGVPFFVVDGRYGISGAQPIEVFAGALQQAWAESHPQLTTIAGGADAEACGPDGCEVPQRP
ncbi:DsbA family oxidoreductase [Ornithinimicrobium pratense]|uniref:DsbA family oxidoreductase n=1 Tax=Ornithinimicrobium pratense TaxID=2593973 RepID=A0A5J6V9D1_9MICO|nr:DsbA family oxidoreductase [Ornithinimicrobium pratense]QFG69632.1 DsbA family oxidoreductase [Ornithinimicrobium pratense]